MEATDSQNVAAALNAATPIPIAKMRPDVPMNTRTSGLTTIIWPYSAVKGTYAFTLAEPDFRLRLKQGQVRVKFAGAAASALGRSGLESGDTVVLLLDGAEWQLADSDRRKSVSGADIDWQVTFTDKLNIQVKLAATGEVKFISAAQAAHHEQTKPIPEHPSTIESSYAPINPPINPPEPPVPIASPRRHKTPAKSGSVHLLSQDEFESPAFIKRARASYGSLFEDGYDIFDDEDGTQSRRKRARFGRGNASWRYTSKSPSPEPEMAESSPKEKSSTPDVPIEADQPVGACLDVQLPDSRNSVMQVDDSVQTQPVETLEIKPPVFTAATTPVPGPLDDHGTRSATDSLFNPSGADDMEDARSLSPSWNMLSATYSPGLETQVPLVESNADIIAVDAQHDLSSLPHDLPHMDPGLMDHGNMLHEMGGNMPIEYHVQAEHATGSPFPQPSVAYDHLTSDYPPLEPIESHQISSGNHYPDPSFSATQTEPFSATFAPNPFTQRLESTSAPDHLQSPFATTGSWTSANHPTQPSAEAFRSRTSTSEGSTSDQPLVLDDSDNDGHLERGSRELGSTFTDDDGTESEQEVDVKYHEDDEEVLDEPEDDAGDYDTMPHPADDEDDSHDEDLQIHKSEPEFDVEESGEDSDPSEYDEDVQDMVRVDEEQGEDAEAFDSQVEDEEGYDERDDDEEEESGDNEDEEEDLDDEEDYSDEEAVSSPPRPPQRPPQPKAPAQPVVIDLLSSSEDEGAEEEEDEEEEEEEEGEEVGATQYRHDTQGQEDETDREEEIAEQDVNAEDNDEEEIEEDEEEEPADDENEDEEQSEDEYEEEDIKEASSPTAVPQARETGNVALKNSPDHAENETDLALAPEYDMEEDEVDNQLTNEESRDLETLEAIASETTRTSQQEDSTMLDVEPEVAAPDDEGHVSDNRDVSDVTPRESETIPMIDEKRAAVEAQDPTAQSPESSEMFELEQSKHGDSIGTIQDVLEPASLDIVPEPKLDDSEIADGPLAPHELGGPNVQQTDFPMSSPPPTQMQKTAESMLEDMVNQAPDVVMADMEDVEVDEDAQQLPTPMDTQVRKLEVSQVETELATSFESAEDLGFSGVSEHMVVSTTTSITSHDLRAAMQAPGATSSGYISQMVPKPGKISSTKEVESQLQSPTIAIAPIEAVQTLSVHPSDADQVDTQSIDQEYLQSSLDDELQASILEDYSQELDNNTSQVEDKAFVKPQKPITQSSPYERRASASARMSTPPRLAQATDDSPESDVGARLVRAAKPSTSQTDTSPRARRLMARTRTSQRTPSPGPATPKVQSSPVDSIKSPKQIKPMQIPMESSPEVEDHSILLARTSFPNQTSAASSVKDGSSRLEDDSESMATIKLQLARHLRDELRDYYILESLRYHLNKTVDVIAMVVMQPAEAQRTKAREFAMSFTITDHSIGPNSVMEVQFYRPHKETLPVVKPGDVILLRRFKVMSLTNKGFGLRTQPDGSSWAVFDREGEPAQIKGPPVEYDAKESIYVDDLREWHSLLDEKARVRLERANKKIIEAGGGKKK